MARAETDRCEAARAEAARAEADRCEADRSVTLAEAVRDEASLHGFLAAVPEIGPAELDRRAAELPEAPGEPAARLRAIDSAIGMVDLTSLNATDSPAAVRALCARAQQPGTQQPHHQRPEVPPVAAVCVYPDLAGVAAEALRGSAVAVASVAGGFPSGRTGREMKLAEVRLAAGAGASEIDVVLDRAAMLDGDYWRAFEELVALRRACPGARLKVILEIGELASYTTVACAGWLALLAGADFLKTSTGTIPAGASVPATVLLCDVVREWHAATGQRRGIKPAGGIRTTAEALGYLAAAREVAGPQWATPELFRFGASSLLDDLVTERARASEEPG